MVEGENRPPADGPLTPTCALASATSNMCTKSINEHLEKYYVIDYLILGYTSEDRTQYGEETHVFIMY